MSCSIFKASLTLLLTGAARVTAHGNHGQQTGESMQQYAARHMSSEHHIDSFDTASFFKLHDLNGDGFLDREEIEAVYGVHHVSSQRKSKDDEEHQRKADTVSATVLDAMDTDKDGKISLAEFEAKGLDALPNFHHLGAEGHHYDIESEFFLHHEEMHHATADTQTDESYVHPEDLEHFAQHEAIEAEEERRERKFQGIPEEEIQARAKHETGSQSQDADTPLVNGSSGTPLEEIPEGKQAAPPPAQNPDHPHDDQKAFKQSTSSASRPKYTRADPKAPYEKYAEARQESRDKPDWGQGSEGYKAPRNPAEKLRRNLPYKYKFRRNWGDF